MGLSSTHPALQYPPVFHSFVQEFFERMAAFVMVVLCLCICPVRGLSPFSCEAREFSASNHNVSAGCVSREYSQTIVSIRGEGGGINSVQGEKRMLEEDGNGDLFALLDLKKRSISKDPGGVLGGWNSSDHNPCSWRGVSCIRVRGASRVHKLNLARANLRGVIGAQIGKLSYLVYLSLSFNGFTGSIPQDIGRLRYLTILDLSHNQLQGRIPSEIGDLKNLTVVKLDNNNLNGSIPSEIGELRLLRDLRMHQNRLAGSIPLEIGNLKELIYLNLSGNLLSGGIPMEIGELNKLEFLSLAANQLSGSIPPQVGNLSRLRQLLLHSNNLADAIPPEIGQLTSLEAFLAHKNKLSGSIIPELGRLKSLRCLNLGNNSFSGELPPQLGMLQNLQFLALNINNISGTIPSLVANLSRLTFLDLCGNRFFGPVPPFLANCSMLRYIKLDGNSLTGEFPAEIGMLRHLHSLSVSMNRIAGILPLRSFANHSSLAFINFCANQLTGTLPESWGQNSNLRVIMLAYNRLEGSLPAWLWSLPNLQVLDASNNKFTGQIPTDVARLQALRKAYLNKASEPETLWQDSIILNVKGSALFYTYVFATHAFIDLSGNNLVGTIPPQMGLLIALRNLNLSNNQLTGQIVPGLGNLSMLESLDLSMNHLSGQIPQDLTRIFSLAVFNVSYNNLSGAIPTGAQFNTFGNSSYLGNSYLCGYPLPRTCSSSVHLGANSNTTASVDHTRQKALRASIITAIVAGSFFLGAVLWLLAYNYHLHLYPSQKVVQIDCFEGGLNLTTSDLSVATDAYSSARIIGMGAFSKVYKGVLGNGLVVAIKKMERASQSDDILGLGNFAKECELLGKIRHRNLVKILCAVSDSTTKALVLQFMPNGSLEKQLHQSDGCHLRWESRYKIALGIAHAIAYLHNDTGIGQIIHCDLKPSNVLLDQDMEAHLSDFGIARMIDPHLNGAVLSGTLEGSIGYMAPELAYGGKLSAKADVYSYGVLLLEIVTSRSPTSGPFPGGTYTLVEWVQKNLMSGDVINMMEMIDPPLLDYSHEQVEGTYTLVHILSLLRVGVICCRDDPRERPSINEVLKMVNNIRNKIAPISSAMV